MKLRISMALVALATYGSVGAAWASNANVPFNGTVVSTCVLTVASPGTLAPNGNYTTLDSKNTGGTSGSVTIISTGSSFAVSADAPTSFSSAPTNGNSNVVFQAKYSATGATSIGDTLGVNPTTLNPGLTNLAVDLNATKSTGVFPQGTYQTQVVVRCE